MALPPFPGDHVTTPGRLPRSLTLQHRSPTVSARPRTALAVSTALAAVLTLGAPALARDDAPLKDPRSDCRGASTADVKLVVDPDGQGRFTVTGTVWSDDSDTWSWRLVHNDEVSFKGEVQARDTDKSLRIQRTMVDLAGPDDIVFRASNESTDEVCRSEVSVS